MKHTKEEFDQVISLRETGLSYRKISIRTGIPESTVNFWCSGRSKPYSAWDQEEYADLNRRRNTPEIIKKRGLSNRGKKRSDETKRKQSLSKMASKNPMWKGDKATQDAGNMRARRMYNPPEGTEIHHKDGNSLNNDPENIEFISRLEHMETDGRMENLIDKNRRWREERNKKVN